ncbi:hypothetical protein GOBAR_DD26259 [Gossypium barbadense]|nr:hypothetical protein GOBAR_DD26259 [Gossypium barbadense]
MAIKKFWRDSQSSGFVYPLIQLHHSKRVRGHIFKTLTVGDTVCQSDCMSDKASPEAIAKSFCIFDIGRNLRSVLEVQLKLHHHCSHISLYHPHSDAQILTQLERQGYV